MTINDRLRQVYGGMGQANLAALLHQLREQQPDGVVIIYDAKTTFMSVKSDTNDIVTASEMFAQAVVANSTAHVITLGGASRVAEPSNEGDEK